MSKKVSIEDLITNTSFVRWMRDECTPMESSYWNIWLQEDTRHQELVKEAEFLLELDKNNLDQEDIEDELSKLKEQILPAPVKPIRAKKTRTSFHQKSWAVAASILIIITALSGLMVINFNDKIDYKEDLAETVSVQKFQTDFGEKKTLRLNDGSQIILNANSRLRYKPTIKKGQDIAVWLEGEAYFNIVHYENEQKRFFTVHTRDGRIQVLGTKFVVNSFGKQTHTVLSEGRVKVITKSNSPGSVTERILKPGDRARFGRTDKTIDIQEVNPVVYTSWIEDKLVFENTSIEEVGRRIENTFGLKIEIATEALDERKLSGSIRVPNIEVLKEALAKLLNAEIEQTGKLLYIEPKDNVSKD